MNDPIPKYSSILRSIPPGLSASSPLPWPTLADLRGAALPCLLLMAAFPHKVKSEWLSQASGYGRDSVWRAMRLLADFGLAVYDRSQRAWSLTETGTGFSCQLAMLFKPPPGSPENPGDGKLIFPAPSEIPGAVENIFPTPSENPGVVDQPDRPRSENPGAVDQSDRPRSENPGAVDKSILARSENPGVVDKPDRPRSEIPGAVDKPDQSRSENPGSARALSLKEVKEEEESIINISSSGLSSRLTSRPPPAPRPPDEEAPIDETSLVARLLQHSADLFGEPLLGAPSEYPDLRRLLAVISEAYHNRHKLRKPARVVYINYRQGIQPDLKYWDATHRYLPREFHEQVGLPYRNPYQDWATPENFRRYEPWTQPGDG